jgi:SAM-dependent methyltransferase
MHSQINFGYGWVWSYGHLALGVVAGAVLWLGWARGWGKTWLLLVGAVTLWALSAGVIVRFVFDLNGRTTLPTEHFLASGAGKVLDMGAGTGRSTLMVLEARPRAMVVALDSFSDEYVRHFGNEKRDQPVAGEGRERLLHNLKAAGVEQRASIQPGDMRQMPFEAATFDAIVSAYAIDHLNRAGIRQSLGEAFRVLKPGGQFLLMVVAKDRWLTFTFGPMLMHMRKAGSGFWQDGLRAAGFEVVEDGTRPATVFILARKP